MKVVGRQPTSKLEYNKGLRMRDMNFSAFDGVGPDRREIATTSKANNDAG